MAAVNESCGGKFFGSGATVATPDGFRQVPTIPVLGTGKLDLKRVKDQTAEVFRG